MKSPLMSHSTADGATFAAARCESAVGITLTTRG